MTIVLNYIDGLMPDCNNSSVLAMELLQSGAKLSICIYIIYILYIIYYIYIIYIYMLYLRAMIGKPGTFDYWY